MSFCISLLRWKIYFVQLPYCNSKKTSIFVARFSAHRRDEIDGRRFQFWFGVTFVSSLVAETSNFNSQRDDATDTPPIWLYINLFIRKVLYINFWRGCLSISLSCERFARPGNGWWFDSAYAIFYIRPDASCSIELYIFTLILWNRLKNEQHVERIHLL